jgi:hypothetical protein
LSSSGDLPFLLGRFSDTEQAVAAVRGSGVGSAKAEPLRVVPERGQVAEDFREAARAERGDVLQEDVAGSKTAKAVGDGEPQACGSLR